jgi:hypothetical protein
MDRAERRRAAQEQVKALRSVAMRKYTYYARDGQQGPVTALFTLFAEREPTAEEVAAFQQQLMAQSRTLTMPRASMWSVEELFEMPEATSGTARAQLLASGVN